MKKQLAVLLAAGLAVSAAGCSKTANTNETDVTAADTTEADAKEEGTEESARETLTGHITLYTSQPEEDAEKLINGFNKEYPDITVDVFRSGTEEVVSKVLAEKQVGALQADVLLVADNVTYEGLKAEDLLLAYQSPELEGIPAEYVDTDYMYTGTKVITTGIVYNTDLVKEQITSFADLTRDDLKDGGIMPSPLYSGAAAYNLGVMTRNSSLGWEFYEDLKSGGITVDKGNGAIQKAVVAGEKSWGILVDYMAVRSKNQGAPVEFVYPAEGSPAVTEPIGILKDSKMQDQAKAFVDFVLSEEGQKLAAEMGYTPVKEGVAPPEGLKGISQLKQMSADPKELYADREADKEKFSQMFQ